MRETVEVIKIKTLCARYDIYPARSKGQNFLINEHIIDQIITAADINPADTILEVGPGLGILTEALVKMASRIVSVELDQKLFRFLQEKFRGQKNLELVNQDILKLAPEKFGLDRYHMVANLPYNITSIFLSNLRSFFRSLHIRNHIQRHIDRSFPDFIFSVVNSQTAARFKAV